MQTGRLSDLAKEQFYDKRHPRSVIGTDSKGSVYFVVIDGRCSDQADGASIWETARICRLMGMEDAVNLDGGGSSTLWNKDLGTISHPSGNRKFDHNGERIVPNIIAAF